MTRIKPVTFIWSGNYMIPLPRFKRQCDEQFVVDEEYPLAILEARSRKSHSHYFACIHEAWLNLPEAIRYRVDPETGEARERFPSEEHLRKWALVKAGFCTHHAFPCASAVRATEMAAFLRTKDSYAVIQIEGDVLNIYEADSQSAAAMGREQFQKSKDAVLEILSDMIRAKPSDLQKMGDQHFKREPKRRAQ